MRFYVTLASQFKVLHSVPKRKPNNKPATPKKGGKTSGGSATSGGMNFQAAVTAIVNVQIARGRRLSWLEGIVEDLPTQLLAETGKSGDDLQIHLSNNCLIEVQVKKGLSAGPRLWEPLVAMSQAISIGEAGYAVLVVCPNASKTIRDNLERDIRRIGDGRHDELGSLAKELIRRLSVESLNPEYVCQRLRIITMNCLHGDDVSIAFARSALEHICSDVSKVSDAWNCLYLDACKLIENRGARDASTLARVLTSAGIDLSSAHNQGPTNVVAQLAGFVLETTRHFEVMAAQKPLSMDDDWIRLNVSVQDEPLDSASDPATALERYHAWYTKGVPGRRNLICPETLGWFYRQCVIVGGPGMGKSTLLTKLARGYAKASLPVLRVKLRTVAARMRNQGDGFEDAVFSLGLDGSAISEKTAKKAGIRDWVLLCDGLDECGTAQKDITEGLIAFQAGYPSARIVVTTRPIGYESALLEEWRHYELLPMNESYRASSSLDLIIDALASNEVDAKAASNFAAKQLEGNASANLVIRSPLLLTMVAVLAIKGASIGGTRASLYERFFELVSDLPNQRREVPSTSSVVLKRFLEIIAWEILNNPTEPRAGIIRSCAEALRGELGISKLNAQTIASESCDYWEDIGLIERVNFGAGETITYVHKTLAEFGAARHLIAMEEARRYVALQGALRDKEMKEVVIFAAQIGLGNEVAEQLFSTETGKADELETTKLVLSIIAESGSPLSATILERTVTRAFVYVTGDRPWVAYEVGALLVKACDHLKDQIGPFASRHAANKQAWTRLVSWTCLVVAKPEQFDLPAFKEAYAVLPREIDPPLRKSLAGGMQLGGSEARELMVDFVTEGARLILELCPAEEADALLPNVLMDKNLHTMGMVEKIEKLLREFDKNYGLEDQYRSVFSASADFKKFDDAWGAFLTKLVAMIGAVSGEGAPDTSSNVNKLRPPAILNLSAFLQLSGFWELTPSFLWSWVDDFDEDAVKEVVRGLVLLCGLPRDRLAIESSQFLEFLAADSENRRLRFGYLLHVDAPELNWRRGASLGLDLTKLEKALYRPCEWTVTNGGSLFANAASSAEIQETVSRLLSNGRGLTLWIAEQLVGELPHEEGLKLIYERLFGDIVSGYEYLVSFLSRPEVQLDNRMLAVAERDLFTPSVSVACSIASVLEEKVRSENVGLRPMLLRAYNHWQEHEEPYPQDSGVVPESPRASLLKTMEKLAPSTDAELIALLLDSRSDLKNIAKSEMQKRLVMSDDCRETFLESIQSHPKLAPTLGSALRDKVPFSTRQIDTILEMLHSKVPEIRFAAMGTLDEHYIPAEKIRTWCLKLRKDTEVDIRNRTRRIIDGIIEPV